MYITTEMRSIFVRFIFVVNMSYEKKHDKKWDPTNKFDFAVHI